MLSSQGVHQRFFAYSIIAFRSTVMTLLLWLLRPSLVRSLCGQQLLQRTLALLGKARAHRNTQVPHHSPDLVPRFTQSIASLAARHGDSLTITGVSITGGPR
jgi:hypothetical protein